MSKKFLEYAIPSALAMFVSSFNTILDGIFLGKGLGDSALTAVSIVMPLVMVFLGLSSLMAVGGGALVSKKFGSRDDERAVNIFRQVIKVLIIGSLSLTIICILFSEHIVRIMGATESLVGLSSEYLTFYAAFCFPNLLGLVFCSFLRNDGRPKLAMIATVSGTIFHITLNYIFIFKLGFGVKSAAIASGLGQLSTLIIMLPHFMFKKGKLSFGPAKIEKDVLKELFNIGFPSFFAESAFSIIILAHNIVLTRVVGDVGLSAYAVVNYVTTNIYNLLMGITLGVQPLISYNFGSKEIKKMLGYYNMATKMSFCVSIIFTVICFLFGKEIIKIFTSDKEIILMAYVALNMANLAYLMIGKNLTTMMYYQAIEMPVHSNIIGVLRSILLLPIILFVFSKLFGINGIWVSMAVSELLTVLIMSKVVNVKECTKNAISL
ncbi:MULTISPECIES: MATE family efflux transporter [unclassified Clostridioides]|uniref:MATE family efflux transporter n=1 Tax=unclassified Clostridioides TaxID=2635829 RepID=UPI001D10DEAA|nr:MATE family efflux transporter [Clostridioides sp. ZZV15-6388]MCC0665582.1 MATE family efflux transporter [Clostridioides sp. ZZV15-6597]MCC0669906.1 MATE family efflux transporter [Clostridioides sp. ZZV14-6153]MCC0719808.1 MATE family efflux transporter [Clostridioides sp. ZZV14-6105]MCC0740080.1 MATE family efflux transporter [Clostridioides sp. ZZV14-5902]MCC0744291.1 MATE family efflux transporter [Clostridioides sp. ZZV14-6044]WLD27175.1 Multidrug export protein MepA [Clostridioides 